MLQYCWCDVTGPGGGTRTKCWMTAILCKSFPGDILHCGLGIIKGRIALIDL